MSDIIELRAIAFGANVIAERIGPDLIAYTEEFDRDSVIMPERPVHLLGHHRSDQPWGILPEWRVADDGLHARGRLVGSASVRENIRELVEAGLTSACSVGFIQDPAQDVWSRPMRRGDLPRVLRRGARISETSLVREPAIVGSGVTALYAEEPAAQAQQPAGGRAPALSARSRQALDEARAALASGVGAELVAQRRAGHPRAGEFRAMAGIHTAHKRAVAGPRDWSALTLPDLFQVTVQLNAKVDRAGEDGLTRLERAEWDALDVEWRKRRQNPVAEEWLQLLLKAHAS